MRLRRTCLSNSGKASQAELDSTVPRQGELERQPRCVQDRPLIFSRFERRDRLLKGSSLHRRKTVLAMMKLWTSRQLST